MPLIIKRLAGKISKFMNWRTYFLLWKLRKMKRYVPTITDLLGNNFHIVDGASFASAYKSIFMDKIYEFQSNNPSPLIIDCGANVGVSILYFKKLFPNSHIVAFEPDPAIFKVLENNIQNLDYKDVSLINKAVWNTETSLQFYSDGADSGRISNNEKMGELINVRTVSLKGYMDKPIDFLKIDIEGAESLVLKDVEPLLSKVKNIFIEYHSSLGETQTLHEILAILNRTGFRYHIQDGIGGKKSPFVSKHFNKAGFDNQLNIFAYKT